jgi:hypothetical protein
MTDQNVVQHLINAQTENLNKYAQEIENVGNLSLDLWKSLITIHALILGISGALMGYLKATPDRLLILTWVLQIVSIGIGFLIFKLYIDWKAISNLASFKFSIDINEYLLWDTKGEFIGNEEKKSGMLIAILMNRISDPRFSEEDKPKWTEYAKKLADKYKGELKSSKLFLEVKKTKLRNIWEFFVKNMPKLIGFFYVLSILAFVALLLSILI